MPVAMPTKELEGRQHAALMITPGGRRRQKMPPQSPKTPARCVVPPFTSAKAGRVTGESPSGSTSTTTTTTASTTPSTTWTMYENPCFCSSHFYSDHPLSATHRHRRRHHHHYHRKALTPERPAVRELYHRKAALSTPQTPGVRDGAATSTPVREQLGTVLERERATVALEREKAVREEAEKLAEALRVELARERRRREEAEGRAAKESDEAARWKAEAERLEGEVRAAKEMGKMQKQQAQAEIAEAMLRFEEEKRKLQQLQIHVQSTAHQDPTPVKRGSDAIHCDHSKVQNQNQLLAAAAEHIRPASNGCAGAGASANLSPAATPCQLQQKHHHQPKKDASPASVENPHIRRGIIGFVEFPRVVGRSRGGLLGTRDGIKHPAPPKLECQKAQLRVLLKGGGGKVTPVAGFPTTAPPHNLVM